MMISNRHTIHFFLFFFFSFAINKTNRRIVLPRAVSTAADRRKPRPNIHTYALVARLTRQLCRRVWLGRCQPVYVKEVKGCQLQKGESFFPLPRWSIDGLLSAIRATLLSRFNTSIPISQAPRWRKGETWGVMESRTMRIGPRNFTINERYSSCVYKIL